MPNYSGTVRSSQGVLTLDVTPRDVITFTPTSATYTVEYPIGTVALNAVATSQSITANSTATLTQTWFGCLARATDMADDLTPKPKDEHWPTYSWRPFIGFTFGVSFFGIYFVLPLLKLPVPSIPFEAWTAFGAILGVASWFRGKAQTDPANPIPAEKG